MLQDRTQAIELRTAPVHASALERLARATVALAQVAPRLSELAAQRQIESERQASRAKDVTGLAREMGTALTDTVRNLRTASSEIGELTGSIRRIAGQTSLIAVNTGIAAARAGNEGRAFAVLATEIRSLSNDTEAAAGDVEKKIRRLRDNTDSTRANAAGLDRLIERMGEAELSATRQAKEAGELTALALRLRELADEMIGVVGGFRLDAHDRAEDLLESLRIDPMLTSGEARRQEQALRNALHRAPFVELAYVTDARGIQVTENVARGSFEARYGDSGAGKDWSRRSWFRGAIATSGVFSSEIYRSAATDEFCLTLSAKFGSRGAPMGVVAVDIDFRQLLGEGGA